MLLVKKILLNPSLVVLLNTLTATLDNIISSGDFKSVVLIHENRTSLIASDFLKRRSPNVDSVVMNFDSDSNAFSKSFEAQGSKKKFLLITLFVRPTLLFWPSRSPCGQTKYFNDANVLSIFIKGSDRWAKEYVMTTLLRCTSHVGLLFWNKGQPQVFTSDLYLQRYLVPINYGRDVFRIGAQQIFYEKHPRIAISNVQNVNTFMIVDDSLKVAKFMKREFGAKSNPWYGITLLRSFSVTNNAFLELGLLTELFYPNSWVMQSQRNSCKLQETLVYC